MDCIGFCHTNDLIKDMNEVVFFLCMRRQEKVDLFI